MGTRDYLNSLIGESGTNALLKRNADLEPVLLPIALNSWVQLQKEYSGKIEDVGVSFSKTEQGISGKIITKNGDFTFTNKSSIYVASAIAINADTKENFNAEASDKTLANLQKSIDSLVKTKWGINQETKSNVRIVQKNVFQKLKQLKKSIKIPFDCLRQSCPACGQDLIKNDNFVSCICFVELSNKILSKSEQDGIRLQFDKSVTNAEIKAVYRSIMLFR